MRFIAADEKLEDHSGINWIATNVLDIVVHSLRENKVDAHELMLLRAIIFFDPSKSTIF